MVLGNSSKTMRKLCLHAKLCRNCAIPQNFYTRKLGEITVFFTVFVSFIIPALLKICYRKKVYFDVKFQAITNATRTSSYMLSGFQTRHCLTLSLRFYSLDFSILTHSAKYFVYCFCILRSCLYRQKLPLKVFWLKLFPSG